MEFELLTEAHLPRLAPLYRDALNAPPWNDRWTCETVTARLSQMLHCEGFYGLVCYEDGVLCGMILGNQEVYYDKLQFQIKEFCVSAQWKGSGIGGKLLAEMERRLAERGIGEIYLFTQHAPENEGFYQKRGYRTAEQLVIMNKELFDKKA